MSEECTHDCSSCKANCDHRAPEHEPPHPRSRIRKVIAAFVSECIRQTPEGTDERLGVWLEAALPKLMQQ